jgi:hypothetical protein
MRWIDERGPGLHGTFPTDEVRSQQSLVSLILSRVSANDGCILWIGGKAKHGYGNVIVGRRVSPKTGRKRGITRLAHRVVWELLHGALPHGRCLDHTCTNKSCVNVLHLEVVSSPENVRRGHERATHCKNGHPYGPYIQGRNRVCPECKAVNVAAGYARHLEANRTRSREYARANRERIKAKRAENKEESRQYSRDYYQKNRKAILAKIAARTAAKKAANSQRSQQQETT